MNEFKFNCPTCGQHILAAHEWIGRKIDCPSCKASITIASPVKAPKRSAPVKPPTPKPKPSPPGGVLPVVPKAEKKPAAQPPTTLPLSSKALRGDKAKDPGSDLKTEAAPAKAPPPESLRVTAPDAKKPAVQPPTTPPSLKLSRGDKPKDAGSDLKTKVAPAKASPPEGLRVTAPDAKKPAVQPPTTPPSSKVSPGDKPKDAGSELKTEVASTTPPPPEVLRVATLTPAIKLDMVRAVRRRIAEESSWLPGKVKGEYAYAAKAGNGDTVPVDVKSPEAKRFSLVGAFLLEFELRQVVKTAPGRTKLLDHEIPDAIREVLLEGMSPAEQDEQTEDPLANKDLTPISHAQCLAVLDVLEERYSQKMEQVQVERAKRLLGNTRLSDLVKKLEKKSPVASEDVATALYHELMDVRRRLDRLENAK